jgi:type VI secretion system protein ImpC
VEGISPLTERTEAGTLIRKPPLEVTLSEHQEAEIATLGFIPLSADPETAEPVFFSTPSLHRPSSPPRPSGSAAATGAELLVQLPFTFARSRFAHYLKRVMLAQIGNFRTATELSAILNAWLERYVLMREGASEEEKAERPLRSGRVELVEDPGKPGRHCALIYLRPHFQLDVSDVCPRAVVEVPVPLE